VVTTGDLPIDDDQQFHRLGWTIQRVGWGLLALFVSSAVLGVYGQGPLSQRTAQSGSLKVEYQRFARREAPSEVRLEIPPDADGRARFSVDAKFADAMRVSTILPEPIATTTGDRVGFEFLVTEGEIAHVMVRFEPERIGASATELRGGGESVRISQLVWP
jgi:hypothetical protein